MANAQVMADERPLVTYPRAFVTLGIRLNGSDASIGESDVVTGLIPDSVEYSLGPHHQAQTAEATVRMSALPFDPRAIGGICLSVFMGDAKSNDGDIAQKIRTDKHLRFIGYADSLEQQFSDKDTTVRIRARDLSSVLREIKPLPPKATPKYADTLQQAISRILNAVGIPSDMMDISDGGAGLLTRSLTTVVGKRAQSGYVHLKSSVSAWEAIEHACGLVNVLVSVELGKVLLRKPTDAFGNDKGIISGASGGAAPSDTPYTFVFGDEQANLQSLGFSKKFLTNRNGVRATCFDPVTRRTLYADFPPDSQIPPKKRPNLGSTKNSKAHKSTAPASRPRDVYAIGEGIHTQDALQACAERLYRERARQEMEGQLDTPVWDDALFDLRNGSRITVKVKPRLEAEVRNSKDTEKAVQLLQEAMALDEETARALVNTIKNKSSSLFYARTIKHRWSSDKADSHVDFINLVDI